MKIRSVETAIVNLPLARPFRTALRTVHEVQSMIVTLTTEEGLVGVGEAVPTHVITGESIGSIRHAVDKILAPHLIGMSIEEREAIFQLMDRTLVGNTSAKAAVDLAIHDLIAQVSGLPLKNFLGGCRSELTTDLTVSVQHAQAMADEAQHHVAKGFNVLKIKVGTGEIKDDLERIRTIRQRIGSGPVIRLDANQGWKPKEAIRLIRQLEDEGLGIELVEQPVAAHDIHGLKDVTSHVETLIMADESMFSIYDARRLLEMRAVDLMNIKLMKTGGIREAMKISALAEGFGVECMAGSMMETNIGATAAAHFAASQSNVTRYDLDAPLLLNEQVEMGGINYEGPVIRFSKEAGLGFDRQMLKRWMKGR